MTTQSAEPTRRVRPWIAALLTFVGWGVGFYYARQTRKAWRWAWLSVVIGVLLAMALVAILLFAFPIAAMLEAQNVQLILQATSLAVTLIVAIVAWRTAAREPMVERAGPGRLAGYLAVWIVPTLVALTLAMAIRFVGVQPFRQPSGSMQPALHVGQYFFVTKWSYGYSRYSAAPLHDLLPPGRIFASAPPQRGDIAVFRPTPEPDRDFVKRIVGLPGDRIQMIGGVLQINGEAVSLEPAGEIAIADFGGRSTLRVPAFRETLPNGVSYLVADRGESEYDNTRVYVVPDGHFFMMGDDRDNSADSRVPSMVGYVPFDNLVGRVADASMRE